VGGLSYAKLLPRNGTGCQSALVRRIYLPSLSHAGSGSGFHRSHAFTVSFVVGIDGRVYGPSSSRDEPGVKASQADVVDASGLGGSASRVQRAPIEAEAK